MKTADIGQVLKWKGKLVQVKFLNEGHRAIGMEFLEDEHCPNCGHNLGKKQFEIIESSLLFQENAEPVETINL